MLCALVVGGRLRARRPTAGRRRPPRRRAPRLGHRARALGALADAPGPVRAGTPRARQLRRGAGRVRGDARASGGREPAPAADRRAGRCARRARDRGCCSPSVRSGPARARRCCAHRGAAAAAPSPTTAGPCAPATCPSTGSSPCSPPAIPDSADGQAVLMRVGPTASTFRPERADWAPNGLIAYSKVCTHAGCPVGLYEAERHQLLCPCHQSAFDVLDGAQPGVRSGGARAAPAADRDRRRGRTSSRRATSPSRSARASGTVRDEPRRRRAARRRSRSRSALVAAGCGSGAPSMSIRRARRPTRSPASGG